MFWNEENKGNEKVWRKSEYMSETNPMGALTDWIQRSKQTHTHTYKMKK